MQITSERKRFVTMKKCICLLLVLTLLVSAFCLGVCAAEEASPATLPDETAALALSTIGVFRGTDTGFELDRAPTRLEASVMLVRLRGLEDDAAQRLEDGLIQHPFTDVPSWAESSVACLYTDGLTRGISETAFGSSRVCRAKDYAVFLLRALGYQDDTDFTYETSESFAASLGFYNKDIFSGTFTRGDLALMTWFALFSKCSDSNQTLLQALTAADAVDASSARTLTSQYQAAGAALCEDGLLLKTSRWQSALRDLTIEVDIASNSPKLAGDTFTLDQESLSALASPSQNGQTLISGAAVRALADGWNETYGVKSGPFLFDSYIKGWTEIDFLTCDYRIDTTPAVKDLLYHLLGLVPGTIDAPLACYHNGRLFSLGDTYAEVDIDNQHLAFYKNGRLVVSSDIVTGKLNGHQTPTGLYYSHNKQTNCTLVGSDFRVFVKYWISIVYDVIGFHDASWRSVFGGEYYVDNGSHGCINTPDSAMLTLFNNLDDGTPVLIYGRNQWYDVHDPAASPVTQTPAAR